MKIELPENFSYELCLSFLKRSPREVLHRIENGHGNIRDIDLLVDVARKIEGNTICPLGDAAAWPVASAIRHFRHEFEYHILHPEKVKDRNHAPVPAMELSH